MNIADLFKSESQKTKEALLSGKLKPVEIEGAKFFLHRLSASYIIELQKQNNQAPLTEDNFFEMLAKSVCDSKGKLIFTVDEARQLDLFTLNSLITEMMDYNALNQEAVDRARAELKNVRAKN